MKWLIIPFLFLMTFLPVPAAAEAPGSVLIWPINPVIEGEDRAAALWLENPGQSPITLQVVIYDWTQSDGKSVYAPQKDMIASPTVVTIAPRARQLVRLTRLGPPPTEAERPYRIVVDEIPVQKEAASAKAAGASVSFRMRYSLPLFSYAPGAGPAALKAARKPPAQPSLHWRAVTDAGEHFLEIRNMGSVHARLTHARFGETNGAQRLPDGLLGYVLPGRVARWPLSAPVAPSATLEASVNGDSAAPIARGF